MNKQSSETPSKWQRGSASFPPPLAGLLVALSVLSLNLVFTYFPPISTYDRVKAELSKTLSFDQVPEMAWSVSQNLAGFLLTQRTGLEKITDQSLAAVSLSNNLAKDLRAAVTDASDLIEEPALGWWDRVGESLRDWADGLINGWSNLGILLSDYRTIIVSNWQRFMEGGEPTRLASSEMTSEQIKEQIRREVEASIRQDLEKTLQQVAASRTSEAASYNAGPGQTLTVFPSTGSTTVDDSLKNKIKGSFSDEVSVQFDETGRSGVITPVFKTAPSNSNYLFILTPLRK